MFSILALAEAQRTQRYYVHLVVGWDKASPFPATEACNASLMQAYGLTLNFPDSTAFHPGYITGILDD